MKALADDFEVFRGECIDLAILINTFDSLFYGDPSKSAVAAVSPQFSSDLNRWLIELYYIKVFRITDKAKSYGHKNLTTNYFVEALEAAGKRTEETKVLNDRLNEYHDVIRDTRRKAIAHADYKFLVGITELSGHADDVANKFRANLQLFCDAVGRVVGVGASDFINIPPGDVADLLFTLKRYRRLSKDG